LTLLGAGLATAIILFLVLGHCTERQQVNGQLAPTTGLLSVITASAGTVTHVFVHASARLPGMSNERDSAALGNTRAAIGAQLRAQRQRLKQNLTTQTRQSQVRPSSLKAGLQLLEARERQIEAQLVLQSEQVASAEHLLKQIQLLRKKDYVSAQQLKTAALHAKAELKTLERQRLQTRRQYGHVASILRSALRPKQVVALTGQRAKQPLHRVNVALTRQSMFACGQPRVL